MHSQTKCHTRGRSEPEQSHGSTDTCPRQTMSGAVRSSARCLVSHSLGALWKTEVKYRPLNMERTNGARAISHMKGTEPGTQQELKKHELSWNKILSTYVPST